MKRLALLFLVILAVPGCGDDTSPKPGAAPPASVAPQITSEPSPPAPAADSTSAPPKVVLAVRALQRDAEAYKDAFAEWASGGDGDAAAAVASEAADAARELSQAAANDGAADLAAAAADYASYYERAAVLVGQGETAYAATEAADGDVDCFKERAHERWTAAAAGYLPAEYQQPPEGAEGVCDKGYGSS